MTVIFMPLLNITGQSVQKFIQILDESLLLPEGLILATLKEEASSRAWDVQIYKKKNNLVYFLQRKKTGMERKILFLENGSQQYVYNPLSGEMQEKREEQQFENILHTAFTFADLSGSLYEANYSPAFLGEKKIGDNYYYRTSLVPGFPYGYKKLILLSDKKSMEPYRIEFYTSGNQICKFMSIKFGNVKIKSKKGISRKKRVSGIAMLDLESGKSTTLKITLIDTEKNIPDDMYAMDYFYR